MNKHLFPLSAAAQQLGVPTHRIQYLITTQKVPEPRVKIAGRRLFSATEIKAIAKQLGQSKSRGTERRGNDQ
jgi:DNA-binding transcriptional MerR regulator